MSLRPVFHPQVLMRRWVLLLCIAGASCTDDSPSEPGAASTVEAPLTTIERATAAEVPLAVGQCGVVGLIRAGAPIDVTAFATVPCEQPHDLEVIDVFEYPASPAIPFPGVAVVDAYAVDECIGRFDDYVGAAYEASRLDVATVAPGTAGWSTGDRRVACLVYDGDFVRLDRTVRGAGI
ncbi:MAG: septum formation family protein [Acidimicrobiia bacterium]|nr:septum formation family protein [Acidimicrobiia bacterium]